MKVDIFTLCEVATIDAGGGLNILGAFDTLTARHTPTASLLFALVTRCRFERLEAGTRRLRLSFLDPDGAPFIKDLEHQAQIHFASELATTNVTLIVIMVRTKLPSFGNYSFDLAVDGRQEASIPLYLRQHLPGPASH